MNATDVLDAYLDQHCKRSFQSSKSMLRGRPPRHGGRNKASRSSPKHVKSSDAGPLSPFSSPARRSKDANPATPRDTKYLQTSKQHSSKAAINPLHKTPQRSASVPTPGQQQTASKPSASLTQHKEAYRRWQKAEVRHSSSLPVLSGSRAPGSKLEITERPRSITNLPQPSPAHPQALRPPSPSARHSAEPHPTAVTKRPRISAGTPSLQPSSSSSPVGILGSFPSSKHRSSNSIGRQLPGSNSRPTATMLGSALLPDKTSAGAAAAVPSFGMSNQENLETPWAAEGRASVLDPPQALLGNMPADSTALWEQRFRQGSLSTADSALLNLKRQVGKQSVMPGRSTKGSDSLTHISTNLLEAPAFRHLQSLESNTNQNRHDSTSHHPAENVLGLSHLSASSADHVGPSVMAQTHAGQPRKTSSHSCVTVSLPESPKKKMSGRIVAATEKHVITEADMPSTQGHQGNAPQVLGLLANAAFDAGPPRLPPAVYDSLSGLHASCSSTALADRPEEDASPSVMMSQRAAPCDSSAELPLRQSDFSRELHRLREQWQARGRDQSLTALGRSADSPRGQSLQQLRQSLLTQQHSRLQATSAPDRPQGIMLEQPLKRQGQGRPEEPNSPSSRSCSPRCRVAKAFRSPPRQGRASPGSPAARPAAASQGCMTAASTGRSNQLTRRCEGSTACSADTAAGETRIKEANAQGSVGSPEHDNDEVQKQSSQVHTDDPPAVVTVVSGRTASIGDLLADVRRIKLAGDSLRAVHSRPAAAAPQGKAASSSPSQNSCSAKGTTARAARHREASSKQAFQGRSGSCSSSCSDYSFDDSTGSRRSVRQSAGSMTGSGTSTERLPVASRAHASDAEADSWTTFRLPPAGQKAAAKDATGLSRDGYAPSHMPGESGGTSTQAWGTPTRAGGSPTRARPSPIRARASPTEAWGTPTRAKGTPTSSPVTLFRAAGTARSREALSAEKVPSRALPPARHMALASRHQSSLAEHTSSPAKRESLPRKHESPPARRAQLGLIKGSAGVHAWGSAGVQGAPLLGTRRAAGGQGVRAPCQPADWQGGRLVRDPTGEPKQTGGRRVGCDDKRDQAWGRYLARAKEKQDLQADPAVISTCQARAVEANSPGRQFRARAVRAALLAPSCPAQLGAKPRHSRVGDLSTKLLQLHKDVDEGPGPSDTASTQSDGTYAATLTALPGRASASLTATGNSPSSLPTTPRPAAISPTGSPAPGNGMPEVCDTDSSSHSGSESYSSSSTDSSALPSSHHRHRLGSFPTHAQHAQRTQHASGFDFSAVPQQKQQLTHGLSRDSSLLKQLPDAANHHWLPTQLEETGALPAAAAEVASRADSQSAATAPLTAQHIRQRYPHLFDCNSTLLQSAYHAADGTTSETDPSGVLCTAASRIASAASSCQVASPTDLPGSSSVLPGSSTALPGSSTVLPGSSTVLPGSSTVLPGSPTCADSPAGAAEEAATCSGALISQGPGSEVPQTVGLTGALRAGQTVTMGLHAAALHESALRLLLKESYAGLASTTQAGRPGVPTAHQPDQDAEPFWHLLAETPCALASRAATSQAGSATAADLTGSQPSCSMPTAGMPSSTAGMPSTTAEIPTIVAGMPSTTAGTLGIMAEMPSTTAGMPSSTAGMPSYAAAMPNNVAETLGTIAGVPSTTSGMASTINGATVDAKTPSTTCDSAHLALASAECITTVTHEHMQQELQQQQQQQNANGRVIDEQQECLLSDTHASPHKSFDKVVMHSALTFDKTNTVERYDYNSTTAEEGLSTAQSGGPSALSTASTAQSALPTAASSAVADQGDAAAAHSQDAGSQQDLSLPQQIHQLSTA